MTRVFVGCAGWALNRHDKPHFPADGSHLERYAAVFPAVEINSSFYRPHRVDSYRRWAAAVPDDFRFAVKLPRTITHEQRLLGALPLLDIFLDEVRGLGEKLAVVLVQLPPSLAFDQRRAAVFLRGFRARHDGGICLEPRHASWFEPAAQALLQRHRIARVAADPALSEAAALPGGDLSLRYTRLHGSPRMYWSEYDAAYLRATAARLQQERAGGAATWCIFDNTAQGHAVPNALALLRILR